ncbi:MAG: M28 family peptidase [Candidatus Asgardarchaeia archaeon]
MRLCLWTSIAYLMKNVTCTYEDEAKPAIKNVNLRVKCVLNLDMIGAGEYLWVWTTEELKKSVSDSIDSLGISKDYKVDYTIPPLPGSDHYPFHLEGVSTTLLIWWPYDHYHLSRDTYDKINPKLIDLTVDLAEKIIKKWMEM